MPDLPTNLVSYYKCDTNGSFPDAVGSNNGTINGATYTASGKINGAYSFDGSNDYIALPVFDTSSTNFHISAWVKFNTISPSANYDDRFLNGWSEQNSSSPNNNSFLVSMFNGASACNIRMLVKEGDGTLNFVESSVTIATGTWYNVQCGYDGTNIYISVNNETRQTTNIGATTLKTPEGFWLGGRIDSSFVIDGSLDEIGLRERDLTTTESSELYNSGDGLQYPFALANYTNFFRMF